MKDRLKILAKFDNLQDEHCTTCSVERWNTNDCHKHCDVGKEIKSLGEMLMQKNRDKTKETLAKGDKMTTREVQVLREKGFTRREIAKSIGVPQLEIKDFFDELDKKSYQEETLDWRREDVKTRYEETLELTKENEEITANEISEKLGVTKTTASTYLSKARGQIRDEKRKKSNKKPVRKVTKSRTIEPAEYEKPKESNEKQEEFQRKEERKMNKLERENKTLKAELGASEKELEQALSEYEDLETIAINLQEMNATGTKDSHENQVNQRIEELEHENRRLKNHNGKQSEELYKREQYINELRDELEAERTKHSHLSNYTRLIMQGEGAANV